MHTKKSTFYTLITLFSMFSSAAFCQQAINISSHSATIHGLNFDYSIGEMALITTEKNTNLIVTQGFLQPATPAKTTNQHEGNSGISQNDLIKVYPNPTDNILFIESIENTDVELNYQLFDAAGKLVISKTLGQKAGPNKFSLDLKNYAAGAYYLMIRKPNAQGNLENFSYKIQKTN